MSHHDPYSDRQSSTNHLERSVEEYESRLARLSHFFSLGCSKENTGMFLRINGAEAVGQDIRPQRLLDVQYNVGKRERCEHDSPVPVRTFG